MHLSFVPPESAKGEQNKNPWVAPFWIVEALESPDDCNMHVKYKIHKVDDFDVYVPVLVNNVGLQPGDVLTWCKKNIPEPNTVSVLKKARRE